MILLVLFVVLLDGGDLILPDVTLHLVDTRYQSEHLESLRGGGGEHFFHGSVGAHPHQQPEDDQAGRDVVDAYGQLPGLYPVMHQPQEGDTEH